MKRNYNYRKIKRRPCKLPLLLTFIRGAIGKEYVIKHYRYGIIKTKYPDMTRIVASSAQRSCRDLFKDAVKQAQKVMADPVKKAAWLQKVKHKHRVFNQLVKFYMLTAKKAAKKRLLQGKYIIRSCFKAAASDHAGPAVEKTNSEVAKPSMNFTGVATDRFCKPVPPATVPG